MVKLEGESREVILCGSDFFPLMVLTIRPPRPSLEDAFFFEFLLYDISGGSFEVEG